MYQVRNNILILKVQCAFCQAPFLYYADLTIIPEEVAYKESQVFLAKRGFLVDDSFMCLLCLQKKEPHERDSRENSPPD